VRPVVLAVLLAASVACASAPAPAVALPVPVSPPPASPAAPPPPTTVASPVSSPSPVPAETTTDYRLGSGDVLEVVVFGNPDLSRTATVQNDGSIAFPLLGTVTVRGLTVSQIQELLTRQLGDKYLVDPQVDVQVREYNSQFVSVLGEVTNPGRRPLRGNTRLIDVLLEAGGLKATASGEVVLGRPGGFPTGETTRRARLNPGGFSTAEQTVLETVLRSGDIITVMPKAFVIVQGEVVRPNRYQIDNELTVTGAISLAGGLTRFGSNKVDVLRIVEPGRTEKLEVDLKAVREGKVQDVLLRPNDTITVPRRMF
jgi:polysaccharide biosynthesis/export protein